MLCSLCVHFFRGGLFSYSLSSFFSDGKKSPFLLFDMSTSLPLITRVKKFPSSLYFYRRLCFTFQVTFKSYFKKVTLQVIEAILNTGGELQNLRRHTFFLKQLNDLKSKTISLSQIQNLRITLYF